MGLYEEIMLLNELVHKENNGLTEEENEALKDVVDYADGCYVNHCEEVGKIAIENIEKMRKEWIEEACKWLRDNANDFYCENGRTYYDEERDSEFHLEEMINCFKEEIE